MEGIFYPKGNGKVPEFIHLIGAEDVRCAGSSIRSAANEMQRAASLVDESLNRHRIFLDDWLMRLETVLQEVAIDAARRAEGCQKE